VFCGRDLERESGNDMVVWWISVLWERPRERESGNDMVVWWISVLWAFRGSET
jgi:hypothetical protein